MIYEHFRATRAYEAVQGLSDLFKKRLQNDSIQVFDAQWDQALLSASETPTDMVLEGLYKSKLLFRYRLYWPCMTKRLPETMGNHVIKGWRHL